MSLESKISLQNGQNNLDLFECKSKEVYITNEVNSNSSLLITNLQEVDTLKIDLNEGSFLVLSLLFDKNVKNLNFVINLKNNAILEGYFAEFSEDNLHISGEINLLNEGAQAVVKLASLSANNDNKNISISVNHLSKNTYGKVDNYGVCHYLCISTASAMAFTNRTIVPECDFSSSSTALQDGHSHQLSQSFWLTP